MVGSTINASVVTELARAARRRELRLLAASSPVVEMLEKRQLMAGDASVVQALPYSLDFDANATSGGILDKDGESTGFTWVMPNKNNNEYQPALVDMVGGRLRVTTTGTSLAGGPWENDNTLVDGLQTQFNGSSGSFSITTRLIGPLGYLNNASEQGGLLFGPDQDNYIKLVAVAQPNGQFLQFVDEQKPSTSFVHQIASNNSYTNIGSFASINTLDLTIAGDAATGQVTAYYRINGGSLIQVPQTVTLSGSQKTKFFSSAARAGIIAMQKNDYAAETLVFEKFEIVPGTPQIARPSIRPEETTPAPNSTDVMRDAFVSAALNLPNVGKGVDSGTLNNSTVKLYRTSDRAAVSGHSSTSGAGDTITFQPNGPLDANTQYTFEVTSGVKDTGGTSFVPFTMTFTTGTRITPTDPNIAFEKVKLPTAQGQLYSGVTMGPDGKLYACSLSGLIQRWSINGDGTLGAAENITTVQNANGGNRFISGITFDPTSTADNLILWVNNSQYAFEGASDWTGKLSRLTGANLENYQDVITGLPRSIRDHLNNQPSFGPDGKLYFPMGSMSAMGAADNAWGLRAEHLLSGAVLQVDTAALLQRIASGQQPLNVRTEGNSTGNYDPWAANAPVKIYASGVRNAFDLVWTRSGYLFAPTNGSAAGGATPASPAGGFTGTRIDQSTNGAYNGGSVPAISQVTSTEPDFLFKIQQGGYYGHPNPTRGEYVLNGGNPTDFVDYEEFTQYPTGTQPDRNYRGAAYDFGKNHSPDGVIEYKGDYFGGRLDGKLLVVRYSGGADVVAITLDANGNVTEAKAGISGLSGFVNPLDLVQGNNGSLYIVDHGAQEIVLARPVAPGAKIAVDSSTLRFNDDYASSNTTPSPTKYVRITNTGTAPLSIPSTGLTLSNTTNWLIQSKPTLPTTIAPGETVEVGLAFKATSGTGAGIKTATLSIASNDPNNPTLTINLRGLAAPGTGGQNEPSLQRILDLYQIPIATGDANPANTNLLSNTEPLTTPNDEVYAQRLVKAGSGPVTIEPLAVYAAGTPVLRFGYYSAGTADSRTELVSVASADAQSVNPTLNGTTSFDPGTSRFGLWTYYPIFNNYNYSEDSLNTKENTVALRRKIRFYPLKNADGSVVPNAYVFTSEDFNNDSTGATDSNDFVGIIRNVSISSDGPEVGLENTDGTPFANRLVFSRVQTQPPDPKTDPVTGEVTQPPNNVSHDTAVMRLRNTGSTALTLNSLALSNNNAWTIVNAPAAGTQIPAGGFLDITVKFIAQTLPSYPGFNPTIDPTGSAANQSGFYTGTMTIGTNDADEPTTTVNLSGWWQNKSEKNQEPSVPVLVNNLFGYKTKITNTGQTMYDGANGASVLGEEVVSRYWVRMDASAPVTVNQLAAFHSQGNTATVRWAPYNYTGSLANVLVHDGLDGQSVLPHISGGTALATGTFKPTAATNNPLAAFTFKIDTEWADDSLNKAVEGNPSDNGHHVRFWPARDQAGNIIPGTWIMGMDYLGINYDYQDNLYVVQNMMPMPPSAPTGLTATGQPGGIALDWADVTNAPLLNGYNVYRSNSSSGPWTKLTQSKVTNSDYLDSSAVAGITYYYRVTAGDSWNGESGVSNTVSGVRTIDNVPPAAPQGVTGVGSGSGVSLTWLANNDADLSGYRVYRSLTVDGTYAVLNASLVSVTNYTDGTASNGSTYFYKISAVDFSGNESPLSVAVQATAGDTTPPAAVTGTTAASADNGIAVTWTANTDADLAGYRVYRSATSSGTFVNVSGGSLVNGAAYTDTTAAVGETWFYRVTAVDTAGNEGPPSTTGSATRVAPALPTIRISAGGGSYTDLAGNVWSSDQYFTGGSASTGAYAVAGTDDDLLYYTRRFGAFTYAIPVPNGQYQLNLHFADSLYTTAGKRIFDVKAEGGTILSNFDIAAQGGGKTKLVKSFNVTISDGALNLQTIAKVENPLLSAIELIPLNNGGADVTPPGIVTGVATSTASTGVALSWTANTESDLAGYNVYRSATANGTYAKVNTVLISGTSYTDFTLPDNSTAYYVVKAVDAAGNESAAHTPVAGSSVIAASGDGLYGKYYSGNNFQTLKLGRVDGVVNFDWAAGSPNPSLPADNFSIRWQGKIKPPTTGSYTFTVHASDGVRLFVNGQLIIDRWYAQGTSDQVSVPITLTAGQKVDFRLDYFEGTGAASCQLFWEGPGITKSIVPRGYLYQS